ncbi:MAG: D-glycero-beta-D-manno-heptose 1-phosphate adenylyltransferase [Candidatus Manganitrophaceae bacterium]|nr:MAG: D-glycero-beta-D-manno-heptose 1-phosphate adenylyltransferase [Candidatus Manganitrophaceae bacterium]
MKKEKRLRLSALQKKVRALQKQGKKVVFTNGCFDLLHVGHVRYLSAARALGDCLVVAINADASVRRLKGTARPIIPHRERMEVLAALGCVDYVVLFNANTPKRVIDTLGPDILVKGGDWALEEIVGRESVERRGGKVVRIKIVPGASTTGIIERILKQSRRR